MNNPIFEYVHGVSLWYHRQEVKKLYGQLIEELDPQTESATRSLNNLSIGLRMHENTPSFFKTFFLNRNFVVLISIPLFSTLVIFFIIRFSSNTIQILPN